jgi:Xaa-Pro aminopeptidase
MLPQSVAIFVSNPERTRSNDTEHAFRQSSDIIYLNGFLEPESALVVSNFDGQVKVTMFVRPKDTLREQWTGIRAGVEGVRKHHLANEAFTVDQFASELAKLIAAADNVYYKLDRNEEFDEKFLRVWKASQKPLLDPEKILHEMRLFKSAEEVSVMRRAGEISAAAHCAAMKRCQPGLREFQLQATLEFHFLDNGAMAPAYGSIVATGANAWVLHYVSNQDTIKDGDLVLIDAACEYKGYASDITRTFPANGKFTQPQREIYQLVLDAQLAALAVAKPGASLNKVHARAGAVMRRGLVKLGILPKEMGTKRGAMQAFKEAKKAGKEKELLMLGTFFPHGTSHWMGLDVHDVGTSGTRSGKGKDRVLEPGMVFTVEPGLYFAKDDTRVPEQYRGIGVRIEDDVLITQDGHENLTAGVPKSVADIEALMAR